MRRKFLMDYFLPSQFVTSMAQSLLSPITCILLMSVTACAPSTNEVVQEWVHQGWKIESIHGTEGKIQRHGKLMSKNARAIEASWIENGERKTQLYHQTNYHYMVLRFFKSDGDKFVVVMKKRK
jgi:hypothetical protein